MTGVDDLDAWVAAMSDPQPGECRRCRRDDRVKPETTEIPRGIGRRPEVREHQACGCGWGGPLPTPRPVSVGGGS